MDLYTVQRETLSKQAHACVLQVHTKGLKSTVPFVQAVISISL